MERRLVSPDPARAGELAAMIGSTPVGELHGLGLTATQREARGEALVEAVRVLLAQERGEGLPEGWVPCTYRWIECDGALAGTIAVRHRLTPWLDDIGGHIGYGVRPSHRRRGLASWALRESLGIARGLGLAEVLVTCDPDNVASRRTILTCGGVYLDTRSLGKDTVQRFRIAVPGEAPVPTEATGAAS